MADDKEKPSEKALKWKRKKNETGASSSSSQDSNYEEQLATLKSGPHWLVRTLREATEDGDWPTNDGPVKQVVGSIEPQSRKYQDDGVSQPRLQEDKALGPVYSLIFPKGCMIVNTNYSVPLILMDNSHLNPRC